MAEKKNDGGPAFPRDLRTGTRDGVDRVSLCSTGMSLRDWFAGQALAGLLSGDPDYDHHDATRESFDYADAMLAASKK